MGNKNWFFLIKKSKLNDIFLYKPEVIQKIPGNIFVFNLFIVFENNNYLNSYWKKEKHVSSEIKIGWFEYEHCWNF